MIDADQTLADHVTHMHMYTHSFTDLIVTVVGYWQFMKLMDEIVHVRIIRIHNMSQQ